MQAHVLNWEDIEVVPEVEDNSLLRPYALPMPGISELWGAPGVGKSWLALQYACGRALGYETDWLDRNPTETPKDPVNVVFATYEDEPAEFRRRLSAIAETFAWVADGRSQIEERVTLVDLRGTQGIWVAEDHRFGRAFTKEWTTLDGICGDKRASLLIIETFMGAFHGDESNAHQLDRFNDAMKNWCVESECAVLFSRNMPAVEVKDPHSDSPFSRIDPVSRIDQLSKREDEPVLGSDAWVLWEGGYEVYPQEGMPYTIYGYGRSENWYTCDYGLWGQHISVGEGKHARQLGPGKYARPRGHGLRRYQNGCFERLWSAYRPQNEVVPTQIKTELKVEVHTV